MQKFNRDNYEPSSETQRQIVQAVRNMQRQVKWMDRQRAMREARNDLLAELPAIDRGLPGWKKRRKERLIMDAMQRATTPQTGWDIYQKVNPTLGSWSGDECYELMMGLTDMGLLKVVGNDDGCGWQYTLSS